MPCIAVPVRTNCCHAETAYVIPDHIACVAVADSAGANILVAALAALRDISSGSSTDTLIHAAVAQTAAAEPADDPDNAAEAAAEVTAAVAELFTSLDKRLCQIVSSNAELLSRASSSNSSSGSTSSSYLKPQTSLASALSSSSSSSAVPDMTIQIGADVALGVAAARTSSLTAAAAGVGGVRFVPPAAVVLVSPAMDISERACFYDEEWKAKHEAR
jgi:hypothetical protein